MVLHHVFLIGLAVVQFEVRVIRALADEALHQVENLLTVPFDLIVSAPEVLHGS